MSLSPAPPPAAAEGPGRGPGGLLPLGEGGQAPAIGAVIATLGRPSLDTAIASVLSQTRPVSRLVVVVDGPLESVAERRSLDHPLVTVVCLGSRHGLPFARNAGIARLDTELVALLDDDDEWLPDKLRQQLARFLAMREAGVDHPVVGCRMLFQDEQRRPLHIAPASLIGPGQRVGDYLFRRRRIRPRGAVLGSSMLLFDRELARSVAFDDQLTRHDDWDWLLRVGARPDTGFAHTPEVAMRYTVQLASNSARRGWHDSAAWPAAHAQFLTPRERADFLLCVTAPIAVMYWDWRGLGAIVGRARRSGPASASAWGFLLGLVGISALRTLRRRLR